jgi:HD-GYP domain-containing protein (c-di-GMP phosphodiesterase class II)
LDSAASIGLSIAPNLSPLGIIAVVDAYDAMTSDRPYRPSLGFAVAAQQLTEGAGKQWDARIIDAFLGSLRHLEPRRYVA